MVPSPSLGQRSARLTDASRSPGPNAKSFKGTLDRLTENTSPASRTYINARVSQGLTCLNLPGVGCSGNQSEFPRSLTIRRWLSAAFQQESEENRLKRPKWFPTAQQADPSTSTRKSTESTTVPGREAIICFGHAISHSMQKAIPNRRQGFQGVRRKPARRQTVDGRMFRDRPSAFVIRTSTLQMWQQFHQIASANAPNAAAPIPGDCPVRASNTASCGFRKMVPLGRDHR